MKVKVVCKKENYELYKKMLENGGFEISEDATLILRDQNFIQDVIIGKYNNSYELISYQDIVYVESFGHDVLLHTHDKEYLIKEKLYEIEGMYEEQGFVRINKSCVINKKQIKEIKPSFNTKLILIMKSGISLEVTRSYYTHFREFIGF